MARAWVPRGLSSAVAAPGPGAEPSPPTPPPTVAYSFAYQPIVDVTTGAACSYEALVRGPGGESAAWVFAQVDEAHLHEFDCECRIGAIELAAELGLRCDINLNLIPSSIDTLAAAVASTVDTAERCGIACERVILEVTERASIDDLAALGETLNTYRSYGLQLAIDDFGAGYAGLAMLADFVPDVLKLDKELVRGIEGRGSRQAIIRAILQVCDDLGIDVIAEGVETVPEYRWLRAVGVTLFQGYLFGRPAFEQLSAPVLP